MREAARCGPAGVVLAAIGLVACGGRQVTIDPATIPVAVAGTYYEAQITANDTILEGSPVPVGLTFARGGQHALLFGMPAAEGTYNLAVRAGTPPLNSAPANMASRDYTLTVSPTTPTDPKPLAFTPPTPLAATSAQPFTLQLNQPDFVAGGEAPYTFAFYCIAQFATCANAPAEGPDNQPPPGLTLAPDGTLSAVVPAPTPTHGVGAVSVDWYGKFIVCAVDAQRHHACSQIEIRSQSDSS